MNYWEENPRFWKNKTQDNDIYQKQKLEIASDLIHLLKDNNWRTVLDVGGYDGTLGRFLPTTYEYDNIDISQGFDITKGWKEQGLVDSKQYDVVVASLIFLTIPPEEWPALVDKIIKHTRRAFYIYEEDPGPDLKHGQKINDDYGGKWAVTLTGLLKGRFPFKGINVQQSKVNKKWVRYKITL